MTSVVLIVACDECGTERLGGIRSNWIDLVCPLDQAMTFCSWDCVQSYAQMEAGKAPLP